MAFVVRPRAPYLDPLDPAHVVDPVALRCESQVQIPAHGPFPDRLDVQRGFRAPRADLSDIHKLRATGKIARLAGPDRGRHRLGDDRVVRLPVVVREVKRNPTFERLTLEADLDLRTLLGTQDRIPERIRRQDRLLAWAGDRLEELGRRKGVRLLSGLAPRTSESELVNPVHIPEGLLAQHPCRTHLRVDREIEVCPEGAVVVEANGTGEEEPIVPIQLFLDVPAECGVLQKCLVRLGNRGPSDRGER